MGHLLTRGASVWHMHRWPHGTHATRAGRSRHTTHKDSCVSCVSESAGALALVRAHDETSSRVMDPTIAASDMFFFWVLFTAKKNGSVFFAIKT